MYTVVAGTGAFNVDLTAPNKPKRLRSWHFCAKTAAADIELRDGSVTGPIVAEIQVALGDSKALSYDAPAGLCFPAGLFIKVTSGGTSVLTGSVDMY